MSEPHHCLPTILRTPPNWTLSYTLALLQPTLSTAVKGSDLFRTEVESCLTSLQNSPLCSHFTQSSCHYPHIGPEDPAWSDPGYCSPLLILFSRTDLLATCQSHHSWLYLRTTAFTCSGSNLLRLTSHHIFFHGRKWVTGSKLFCASHASKHHARSGN